MSIIHSCCFVIHCFENNRLEIFVMFAIDVKLKKTMGDCNQARKIHHRKKGNPHCQSRESDVVFVFEHNASVQVLSI